MINLLYPLSPYLVTWEIQQGLEVRVEVEGGVALREEDEQGRQRVFVRGTTYYNVP